jgi:hypothetical protein
MYGCRTPLIFDGEPDAVDDRLTRRHPGRSALKLLATSGPTLFARQRCAMIILVILGVHMTSPLNGRATGFAAPFNLYFVFAALALTHPTNAVADWQYTRWGMTVDEVVKASKGQLKPCDAQLCSGRELRGAKDEVRLIGNYASGQYSFKAYFYFDSKKLSIVTLDLNNPTLGWSLGADLRARYGEPSRQSRDSISSDMQWQTKTDRIYFMTIGSGPRSASVSYRPRITAGNQGL